jgi:DNA repair exonuclease SbcCD nuclease subunit
VKKNPQKVFNQAMNIAKKDPANNYLLLCHQLFDGATFGPHQFVFRPYHGAIKPTKAPTNVQLIITGHIHRAQALHNNTVVYPGSIERTSFCEAIEPKGYLFIEIEKDYLEVSFNTLPAIPMVVQEINIDNKLIIPEEYLSQTPLNFHRSLMRFFGRALSQEEIALLYHSFPKEAYPLLTISPKNSQRVLKPLYDKKSYYFSFSGFKKTIANR